ncbi:N-acetyltransferase [Kineobactrum sediminis]|uniref:N-acetyltransferase n=1 Tax=Kineobactrum sediminis TaxID=1905677 RepID=A0A2N5Y691_9GAMM|nr:GNAT family N-acetyltransferase [Kineobactrum sediminis]PLW83920.1 N-acetyltransferase [Kineobactrum sediminis]
MSITFRPLTRYDDNYSKVIDLYKGSFPGAQRIPSCLLRYKLRHGKKGFDVLYEDDNWVGLVYATEFRDINFLQFLAISESLRAYGYGSKVMASMRYMQPGKRIVLNIEELDEQAQNSQQRVKRKAFYEKNGFSSSGYIVREPDGRYEMLIKGGSISKEEIEAMYRSLFGHIIGFFIRPEVIKI